MFDAKVKELASAPPLDEQGKFLVWARYCQIHQDPVRRELAQLLAKTFGLELLGRVLRLRLTATPPSSASNRQLLGSPPPPNSWRRRS